MILNYIRYGMCGLIACSAMLSANVLAATDPAGPGEIRTDTGVYIDRTSSVNARYAAAMTNDSDDDESTQEYEIITPLNAGIEAVAEAAVTVEKESTADTTESCAGSIAKERKIGFAPALLVRQYTDPEPKQRVKMLAYSSDNRVKKTQERRARARATTKWNTFADMKKHVSYANFAIAMHKTRSYLERVIDLILSVYEDTMHTALFDQFREHVACITVADILQDVIQRYQSSNKKVIDRAYFKDVIFAKREAHINVLNEDIRALREQQISFTTTYFGAQNCLDYCMDLESRFRNAIDEFAVSGT
ncbi:MAG: hypothetical protein V4482_04700 [Pseudomonadota bacterium]